ncbi:DUF3850 domain-containing protein [Candidatus Enterococcus ferrettii]|uniref:DUF3850 domain-containing protein n=1 Tax=Candidatus Enterococcus ferrettii TaxID=2815324 RepID=A0ABV0EI29_9ENTE|nr:DUF3850 domain-containing protein [Enterococcus sp. 665A]MBO1341863.1 DUF3850 domain-containing protein [Enterococcus sp. 665A]
MNDVAPVHQLKIAREYYEAIITGKKKFEIRKNDRNFKVGDAFVLREYKDHSYTGKYVLGTISYITDYEQKENFVVFSFQLQVYSYGKLPFEGDK